MVTPFTVDGSLELGATRLLASFLIDHGVHAIMVGGTTGEGMLLTTEERERLLATVLEQAAGRCAVIAHTGCISTAETIRLTRHARDLGAAAATIVTPYFFTLDDEALLAHYLRCAQAAQDLPIFLYTIPSNARNDISPELLRRIRGAAPNVVGMKCSNPNVLLMQQYLEAAGDHFTFIGGVDGLMLPVLLLGGKGQVSGNSNAFPEAFRALYDAFLAGDMQKARHQQQLINRIRELLKDGHYPAYYKTALMLRGVPAGRVRPPMRELTRDERTQLERGMSELGLV
jgi:4-hydroxy-tetrahydrodipicolinate synthase